MVRFSRQGEAPTEFERRLVAAHGDDEPVHVRQLWLRVAQRIGIDALCVVLDEMGGMTNLSVPTRSRFFRDIYRNAKLEEIERRLLDGDRASHVARSLNMSRFVVLRVQRKLESAKRPTCQKSSASHTR